MLPLIVTGYYLRAEIAGGGRGGGTSAAFGLIFFIAMRYL